MFKLRTWILSLALAVCWGSVAYATPPDSVAYGPGAYASNGTYGNGAYANGAYGGGCANGYCGVQGNITPGDCGHCRQNCPHPYRHCVQGPPHVRFPHGCPAPVCSPCGAPNWGYFQPCWNPWPWPPTWAHCPAVPPAALVAPGRAGLIGMPEGELRKGGL